MSNFLEDEQEIKTELISTETHYMNGTIEFIDHTKDKVAAAVDQTLVGAVEEKPSGGHEISPQIEKHISTQYGIFCFCMFFDSRFFFAHH